MKVTHSIALLGLALTLAACGQKADRGAQLASGPSPLVPTNKVLMRCKAIQRAIDVEVRQYKDAQGQYGSDSLYVINAVGYGDDAGTTAFAAREADVFAPTNVYWLLLGSEDGASKLDVRADRDDSGALTSPIKGKVTLSGDEIAVYCGMGDAHLPGPMLPTSTAD